MIANKRLLVEELRKLSHEEFIQHVRETADRILFEGHYHVMDEAERRKWMKWMKRRKEESV